MVDRILVAWADKSSPNLGVQALAWGSEALVKKAFPAATVAFQNYSSEVFPRTVGTRSLAENMAYVKTDVVSELKRYDLLLDMSGGDSFTDAYGVRRLIEIALFRELASRADLPVVLGPQTIGPFSGTFGKLLARASLRNVSAILARDSVSIKVGGTLTPRPVCSATDVVFCLPRVARDVRYDAIVNVSGLLARPNTHVNNVDYVKAVEDLVATLNQRGMKVALLSHVRRFRETNDEDDTVTRSLAEKYSSTVDSFFPDSVQEARTLLATARVVIASRMHACLNALSCGVPTIPWAYSRKFAPLLTDLGWPFGCDLRKSTDLVGETLSQISRVFDDQDSVSSTLDKARLAEDQTVLALREVGVGR